MTPEWPTAGPPIRAGPGHRRTIVTRSYTGPSTDVQYVTAAILRPALACFARPSHRHAASLGPSHSVVQRSPRARAGVGPERARRYLYPVSSTWNSSVRRLVPAGCHELRVLRAVRARRA